MVEHTAVRWVLVVVLALAVVALLAYARGPRDGLRRSPDRGHLGAPALVHDGAPRVAGA